MQTHDINAVSTTVTALGAYIQITTMAQNSSHSDQLALKKFGILLSNITHLMNALTDTLGVAFEVGSVRVEYLEASGQTIAYEGALPPLPPPPPPIVISLENNLTQALTTTTPTTAGATTLTTMSKNSLANIWQKLSGKRSNLNNLHCIL